MNHKVHFYLEKKLNRDMFYFKKLSREIKILDLATLLSNGKFFCNDFYWKNIKKIVLFEHILHDNKLIYILIIILFDFDDISV